MTSTIVPPVDLAPGMPSRVVTISATDVTEGGQSMAGATVTFALSDSLDASGGVVIAKTQATVTLDSNGSGRIRVPVYTPDAKTWCGSSDWAVLVSASWGSQKAVRVPAGTSAIALSALPNVRPLTWEEMQWTLTGAGVTVVEGSQWGATVSLDDGVLEFVLTVPPGGTAWWKGMLGASGNVDTLEDGAYGILSSIAAEGMGLPEHLTGVIESYQTAGVQLFHVKTTGEQRTWQRSNFSSGWTGWQRVDAGSWYKGNLDEQTGTLATLDAGLYLVRYVNTAEAWGLPQRLIGQLEVVDAGTQRRITYTPNDAGAGFGTKSSWEIATNSNGELRDRWQRSDKAIMRTAPVVLTAPAGEYGPVAVSREAVRLPFTVPTNVSRVRVHMRPWNYRTEIEWGPARLEGVMIAQAAQDGVGTITGSRWYAPNAAGATVPGAGWTSEWFHVGLVPDTEFLLSYGAEWLDASRDLVSGKCWTHADRAKYDTTEEAVYGNGWGGFTLQPMDIWIECEAPSNVPINMYIGASNNVFAGTSSVFMSYPTQHARRNGAFCALTAAGGWSIMDASMHKADIINRFGYPARIADRIYLDMGSNIAIRDATAQDAIAEMTRWMNTRLPSLGSPPVHLLTQISSPTSEDTGDSFGTLSEWNEWIRYEATKRPEVVALHDQAAMFADPERPWTARRELRESPTDVHFSEMGQKLRAQALDGELTLPMLTAKNPSEMAGGGIPIFPTLAEAQAWEGAHPGRLALTVEDPSPDTTPPSPGDLLVTPEGTKAHVSVVGASDERFVPLEYSIRRDGGAWTSWQTDPSFTLTGLSVLTSYTVSHRVRDGGGNIAVGPSPVTFTTLAADLWGTSWVDDFDSGGLLEGRAMSRGAGTWRLPVALGSVGGAPDHGLGFTAETMPRLIGGKVQNSVEVHSIQGVSASRFQFPVGQSATGALVQLPKTPARVEISMTVMAGSGTFNNRIIPIVYGESPSMFTTIEMDSTSEGGKTQFHLVRGNGGVRTGGGPTAETPKTPTVGAYEYTTEATLTVEIQGRSLSMWHGSAVLIEDHAIPETIPLDGAWFGFAFATNNASASVDNFSVRWE